MFFVLRSDLSRSRRSFVRFWKGLYDGMRASRFVLQSFGQVSSLERMVVDCAVLSGALVQWL